jgi:transglutaminase-like putative cysteine protease
MLARRAAVYAFAIAFLSAVPFVARAQAPRVTQQGDPTVKSDTIYKLAAKPSDFPDEESLLLLDDGIVRLEADGRGTQTFRQVVQILKPDAVDHFREFRFSYAPKHERFTLNWIRVVKPTGEVISDKPSHEQDSDVPAQMGDPVYSDRKVKRLSLTGVEAGTIVDYSYTREELKPYLAGDFFQSWSVSTGSRVMRSRYIVDVPAKLKLRINEKNLNFPRKTVDAGDRRVYTWATGNLPKIKSEPFAADSNGVLMSVALSSPMSWGDIGKWYATNAKDRYAVGPAVADKLTSLVSGARTRDDTIRAVHKWVAQDVRYVSIALGMGGYQPRSPDEVLKTGFGDCKDKATLFVAALNKLGIPALPVLLNSTGVEYRDLPTIEQLDHAIAAVKTPAGYLFTDLTSEYTPYGELPEPEQGELALVVHPDGATEEMSLPRTGPAANKSETRISGVLSADGYFNGRYDERATGSNQYGIREAFENPLDSTQKANIVNSIASRYFDGAEGDSLVSFAGKDLNAEVRLSLLIKHGKATSSAGATEIFTIPFGNMVGMLKAAKELDNTPKRLFPVDAEKVLGNQSSVVELRVRLPAGWKAQLPPNVIATSEFGSYISEYAQMGDELRITRRTEGRRGVFPPEKAKVLADWFRAMARDDAKIIVIAKTT